MRLAIFTLPLHTNYGGLLQAYALQTVLQRLGHQAVVLRKKEFSLGLNIPPSRIINRLKQRFIDKEDCYILYERKMKQLAPVIRQHTERFVSQHINSFWLWRLNSLRESDFDGYVVGSDQVWRPVFFRNIGNAFLDFTAHWNVRRVAYAASFGTDSREYTDAQVRLCRDAIARFDGVSVREESGMELCRQYFGVEAEWVLDPTMLLLPTDYEKIVRQATVPQSPGNLFCYTLDDSPLLQQTINSITSSTFNPQHSTLNTQLSTSSAAILHKRLQREQTCRCSTAHTATSGKLAQGFHRCALCHYRLVPRYSFFHSLPQAFRRVHKQWPGSGTSAVAACHLRT